MPENTNQLSNKKPQRLGRGLGSLLGGDMGRSLDEAPTPISPVASVAASKAAPALPVTQVAPINEEAQIWNLPIEWLTANTQQPRQTFEPEALRDLTASIKEKGILQPIVARKLGEQSYEIIAGERRWRAAQGAGLHKVPVILKKVTEQDSLEYAIIENIQRADLNPMEEAEAYENLMTEYGLTQQEVADRLGKERSSIANSLRLITLTPDVKALLRSRELSAGHAKVLAAVAEAKDQARIARQIVSDKLSVRQAEKLVAQAKKKSTHPTNASPLNLDVSQRLIEGLAGELQKLVGTKVAIDYNKSDSKGKISIHFYSDDQLTSLVDSLRKAWQK